MTCKYGGANQAAVPTGGTHGEEDDDGGGSGGGEHAVSYKGSSSIRYSMYLRRPAHMHPAVATRVHI